MGRIVRKFLLCAFVMLLVFGALLWAGDWFMLRRKIARGEGYGEVEVHHRYAVHLKNKRIEQRAEEPTIEECVHAIFPYQERPCWYLQRHADDIKDLNGGPWHFFYDE